MSLVVNSTNKRSTSLELPILSRHRLRLVSVCDWIVVVLLLTWCGFLFFYSLSVGELWRTESLRAIIAAEFLRSGNWIVPTLYGEPLLTKPPGMYAAIALVSWPFGEVSEWTARLPSALAATGTVFLFFWYFRRTLGWQAGVIAAAILPASFMWLDKASSAEIDMLQVAWVSAAIVCLVRALEAEESADWSEQSAIRNPQSAIAWWFAALLCVAGGVLTKWTAPVFFYAAAIPLLWWRGRLRLLWGWHHLASATLGAGLCLAWAATAISIVGWDVFAETVSREAWVRVSPGQHLEVMQSLAPNHHSRWSPWLSALAHPFRILAANLPWSVFALLTLRPGFMSLWDERGRRLLQALHCWTWPNLIFWSAIPEHALRHSFPLFPGIAGLAAFVWIDWLRRATVWKWRIRSAAVLVTLLSLWLVVKLVHVHAVIPGRDAGRQARAKGEQLAAVVPADQTLYLFRLKDEGIMFYYGRAARRLAGPAQLPSSAEPLYCILTESEWRQWPSSRAATVVLPLNDGQGDPIVLIRVDR